MSFRFIGVWAICGVIIVLFGCESDQPYPPCPDLQGTITTTSVFVVNDSGADACAERATLDVDATYWANMECYQGAFAPIEDCVPVLSTFSYGPDRDCMMAYTTCAGVSADPMVEDCSVSTFGDCCGAGDTVGVPPCE